MQPRRSNNPDLRRKFVSAARWLVLQGRALDAYLTQRAEALALPGRRYEELLGELYRRNR